MGLQYEIAGNQIDGARDYQEDAFLITHLTDAEGQPTALVVVADGMGGHAAGNVASNMAVQAFNKYVSSNYPAEDITGLLQGGVLKANGSIAETIRETPALQGMGCTMVAILIEQDKAWWASVGDSHLYLLREKDLIKKNADHSYGGFLDRLAAIGQQIEPEPGLSRNMLMSAVTGEEITEIDCPEEPLQLQAGDRLLICSDGLDTLSKGKIIQYAEWSDKPRDYVQTLLQAVEEAAMPRQDNTTAIVIDIVSKAAGTVEAPPVESSADLEVTQDGEVELSGDMTQPQGNTVIPPAGEPFPSYNDSEGLPHRHTGLLTIAAVFIVAVVASAVYVVFRPATEVPPTDIAERQVDEESVEAPTAERIEPLEPAETPEPQELEPPQVELEIVDTITVEPDATLPAETFRDPLKNGGHGPVMVPIPAGSFAMGSSRFSEERPEHTVEVRPFAISQHEVTIADYERFARATGTPLPNTLDMNKTDHPVINVNWQQAMDYTQWLSEQTGYQYRLPSEAEWEYAASTGRKTDYWWGVTMKPNQAHCFGCETGLDPRTPTRIGSFPPNPFGLHDTEGNVAEWVLDCWHKNYESAPETSAAWVDGGDCSQRVVRGGSYNSPPTSLRNSRRDKFKADEKYDNIGFRVVREVE